MNELDDFVCGKCGRISELCNCNEEIDYLNDDIYAHYEYSKDYEKDEIVFYKNDKPVYRSELNNL